MKYGRGDGVKIKVKVNCDEIYPVWGIEERPGFDGEYEIEIEEKFMNKFKKICAKWEIAQKEMGSLMSEHRSK